MAIIPQLFDRAAEKTVQYQYATKYWGYFLVNLQLLSRDYSSSSYK